MLTMGVDIGSTSSKAILVEDGCRVLAKGVVPLGTGTAGPMRIYRQVLEQGGVRREDIAYLTVTGYGRLTFSEADDQVSEVSCHGKGIRFLFPGVHTVIDIGGQDAKVMRLNPRGGLSNFVMNDKCAAGTGRFLDVMARVLDVEVNQLGAISARSSHPLSISNVCTVFAESEVISHLASGAAIEDIIAGIHLSVARRTAAMAMRIGVEDQVSMSGGVALNEGIVRAMQAELKRPILVHKDTQLAGAYGAAILAYEKVCIGRKV